MSKPELSHEEVFAVLDAVALDALDGSEREAVLAHVAWCATCRAELKILRATAAQVAFAVPAAVGDAAAASRDRVRSRLMSRVAADSGPQQKEMAPRAPMPVAFEREPDAPAPMIRFLTGRRAEWVAMAASVLFVASLGMLGYMTYDRHGLREAFHTQLAFDHDVQARSDSIKTVIAARDSMISSLIGRDVSVMRLTSGGAHAPFAFMFWDKSRNAWTLSAHNMPPLRAGRTYQLWLVTANAKISAGTFDPKNGDAVVRASYALSPNALVALAVTEEQAGGAPQPTGAPVIAVSTTQ